MFRKHCSEITLIHIFTFKSKKPPKILIHLQIGSRNVVPGSWFILVRHMTIINHVRESNINNLSLDLANSPLQFGIQDLCTNLQFGPQRLVITNVPSQHSVNL